MSARSVVRKILLLIAGRYTAREDSGILIVRARYKQNVLTSSDSNVRGNHDKSTVFSIYRGVRTHATLTNDRLRLLYLRLYVTRYVTRGLLGRLSDCGPSLSG